MIVIRILVGMVLYVYFVRDDDGEMCTENYYVMMTEDINRLTLTNVIIKRFSFHDINSVAKRQKRDEVKRTILSNVLKLILKAVYRTHFSMTASSSITYNI